MWVPSRCLPWGVPRAMASDLQCGGAVPLAGTLRVGTWNMSHWSVDKVHTIVRDIPVDVLALQETHLAPLPSRWSGPAPPLPPFTFTFITGAPLLPWVARPMADLVVSVLWPLGVSLCPLCYPRGLPGVCSTPCVAWWLFSFPLALGCLMAFSCSPFMPRSQPSPPSKLASSWPCWS